MKRFPYMAVVVLFGGNVSYAGESVLDSLRASVPPSALSGTVLPDASKGHNPLTVKRLTETSALLPESGKNRTAPQNSGPASDRPAALPDLCSKVYIPGENLALYPDAVKETPGRESSASKSAYTKDIGAEVSAILKISSQTQPYQAAFSLLSKKWEAGIAIHRPQKGYDFTFCTKCSKCLAFAYPGKRSIYMCNKLIDTSNVQDTVQTLIHESAHAVGYSNECDATKLELSAMRKAGLQPYRNCHADKCGL